MLVDLTRPDPVFLEHVGGKAYNLHILTQMGLPVPPAVAVHAAASMLTESERQDLREEIMRHHVVSKGNKFAVRSSGVGEDGAGSSFAGIFESYLDIDRDNVFEAVQRVWSSIDSARSAMYANERLASVNAMGVVIQHMVEADYAGVAFSVCPVEKDDRIALLEIVQGNGDSLVAGTKTPATIRINKLTGMMRVSRNGADNIPNDTLESICDSLLPLVERIEERYGMPMDIEWAIAVDKPYILQARPITT
jgi:pyruvate,water dikinase